MVTGDSVNQGGVPLLACQQWHTARPLTGFTSRNIWCIRGQAVATAPDPTMDALATQALAATSPAVECEAPSGQPLAPAVDAWKSHYAEIAALAGGLAHEIRTPLSTIRLNLELLEEELGSDGTSSRDRRNRQRVQKVLGECEHLERILGDFLQFARAHSLQLEPTNLNHVVQEFLAVFAATTSDCGVEVSPHLAAQLPIILLDARLFRQVLVNLATNAVQAMPNGGRLEVLTYGEGRDVVLEMIDTGCGMDERTKSRMFDTFFSTKQGGSGLGLPTVRRIVECHGGTIECASAVGAGTRFCIRLPAVAGSA